MADPRAHATRGASSAYRWMNCPGSLNLIETIPEGDRSGGTNFYASQGHAAHSLAEMCLLQDKAAAEFLDTTVADEAGDLHVVDFDMANAVQVYLDEIARQRAAYPTAESNVELRFDLTWLRPDMFGTCDHVLTEPFGDLVVTDYKHGAGVVVEVVWNAQLMYYALGALYEAGGPENVDQVTIVVVQPRARHADGPVRSWTLSAEALWEWRETLAAAADATRHPNAALAAGDWCRFCPAAAICPETRALVQRTAALDFADAPLDPKDESNLPAIPVSPEELAQAMNVIPVIDAWCRAVEGEAQARLTRGQVVPGYKLVRKRANRRWKDEADVERKLKNKRGVKTADIYKRTLQSPAQIEKILGGKDGKAWVAKYAIKPEGGLTVAHESDARDGEPAPALADFNPVEETTGPTVDADDLFA